MHTLSCFANHFPKGNNLPDFLYASLDDVALSERELLLKERICFPRSSIHSPSICSVLLLLLYLFIYSAIRWGFALSRMATNNYISHMKFAIKQILSFLTNPKDLDPSYKMDLDLWDCFGRNKLHLITQEIWYLNQKT